MILLDPVESIERMEGPAGGNGSTSHASASSSNGNSSSSSSSYQPSLSSGVTTAGHSDTGNETSSVSFRASTSIEQFTIRQTPEPPRDYDNRGRLQLFPDLDDTRNLFQSPKLLDLTHDRRPREASGSSIEVVASGAKAAATTSTAEQETNKELDEFNARLLSFIECPVCLEPISPPVHQCRRGHLVLTFTLFIQVDHVICTLSGAAGLREMQEPIEPMPHVPGSDVGNEELCRRTNG